MSLLAVGSSGQHVTHSASDMSEDSVIGVASPVSAEEYIVRGDAYWDKDVYDSAFLDYDAAIRVDPNSTKARYLRGFAYYTDKSVYDSALADFNEAIRLDFNYGRPHYGRGLLYV